MTRVATRAHAATALAVASCLVLVGASAAAALGGGGGGATHVTAHFSRAVGLYEGSTVKMLGVAVGKINHVTPQGTTVAVEMTVDSGTKVPADSDAVIVPPSLVSDRYVQLSVFRGGAVMTDRGDIPLARTQAPVEKDEIVASLDKLDRALGPDGANKTGSLSRLLTTGARNLGGNGEQINQTLRDVTSLVTVLDDNKDGLTGTVGQLDTFTSILLKNDGGIRRLYTDLASVSAQLDDDRTALGAAFKNLAVATKELRDLAQESRGNLKADLSGLTDITNVLVQNKTAIEETLDTAPLGLANLSGAYSPLTQTLDVRSNTPNTDGNGLSLLVCTFLQTSPVPPAIAQPVCDASKTLPPPGGGPPGLPPVPGPVASLLPVPVPSLPVAPPVPLPVGAGIAPAGGR